jgi:hypothetical protein
VSNGYISIQAARDRYGVVIDAASESINSKATEALRADLRPATSPAHSISPD